MLDYKQALAQTGEYGIVEELRYPLVIARGLPGATIDEVVLFANNQQGQVIALNDDLVEILLLSADPPRPSTKVTRTDQHLMVPVGEELLGNVVDALGKPLVPAPQQSTPPSTLRRLDARPLHIGYRVKIKRPFLTGSSLVDLMLPLGAGQREVVIGDKKTGKTAFLYTAVKAAIEQNILVVFAAIGKPWNAIADLYKFISESAPGNVVIVASSASEAPGLIVLTPLTAMTIAEHFRDAGRDTLVIMDDLSTHAYFYREIALLARRFPGRESYPGDIFHIHARLLERAGNFKHTSHPEGVAITCLPVAETVQSDLTGYIVSNLISITDGHLLFDITAFNQGRRPAIDHTHSITRVGHQTQPLLAQQLYQELTLLLGQHARAQSYTQFGAELTKELRTILDDGNKLITFFSQPLFMTVPQPIQLALATMIWQGWLRGKPDDAAGQWRDRLVTQYAGSTDARQLLDTLTDTDELPQLAQRLEQHQEELTTICQTEKIWRKK